MPATKDWAPRQAAVVIPPHCKFKKNPPDWYEEMHERQRRTPLHDVSVLGAASPLSRTGGPWPATSAAASI